MTSRIEKLEAMAADTSSPHEAKIARARLYELRPKIYYTSPMPLTKAMLGLVDASTVMPVFCGCCKKISGLYS